MADIKGFLDISYSPKKILLINPDNGRILDASQEALSFYGWSLQEMQRMTIYEINTLRDEEIQAEMRDAVLSKRNYFRFRHITKPGEIRRVKVTSLPIRLGGENLLLSVIEHAEEVNADHFEDFKNIYEFSADPLVILKVTDDAAQGVVVHINAAARSFLGNETIGTPLSESVLVYDRSNFEAALNRMTGEYYYETDILFKTPQETVVKSVGLNRLFYDADYYVLMQIRPPRTQRLDPLRINEVLAELNEAIMKTFIRNPEAGCFGMLSLDDSDFLLRSLGKEVYLKILLAAGKAIKNLLGESADYALLDESVLFFHGGQPIRDERLREAVDALNKDYETVPLAAGARIQCVATVYQGESYNPELGLAHHMIAALEKKEAYQRIKMITDKDVRRDRLNRDLARAIRNSELFVLYQPIVDIVKGEIVSLEALVRWRHPQLGVIEPGEFIGLAEEHDLITQIDSWVVDEVLSQPRDYPVHVNLSTQDLLDEGFRNRIIDVLRSNSEAIILELTETTNYELSEEISEALSAVNAKLSIDDFGTGYSSMARLVSLDVNSLKIDQSFVMNSVNDVESASICIAIIRLGKGLNIEVIAEGAETPEQIRFLYKNGCRLIQGYGISRPIPYEALQHLDVKRFKLNPQDKYGTDALSASASQVDFNTAMMLEMSEDFVFIRVPLQFCRFTGYSQAELKKMTLLDLVPEEERGLCEANCRILKDVGYIENVVFYIQRADGSRRCVAAAGKKGTDGDRSLYLYIEQNDGDEERIMNIQGAQGAYNTLFHEGPLATVVWRQDFEIIDWNQEAEVTFGWTREEAMGRNLIKLLVRKSMFPDYMNVVNDIQTQSSVDSINYNVTRSGKQIICRWVNRAVLDRQGNVRFYISMAKDITEDLMKNDRIKQLSSAVEKSGSGVVVTDSAGKILSINSSFSEVTGYSETELVGRNISLLSSRELPREIYDELWATISGGEIWEGEVHNKRKDGSLYWCRTTIVPVVSEWSKTVNFLGIQKDLTSEKDQEEQAAALRTLLVEQGKLATLGSMMAGITHETYNFMAYAESNLEYTRNMAQKALSGVPINHEELLRAVEDSQEGVARIKNMLKSLKMVSRKEEKLQAEDCDIQQEILMVSGLVKNEYKYHATLEHFLENEITHRGYPGLLRQVLMNILINAAHAIKARNTQALGKITIQAEKTEEWVRIVIQDDGVGMDEEVRGRIFEPFFTTKKSGEGTGLGLSISKNIIEEQYGGRLSCESEPGKGTVFIIEVPEVRDVLEPDFQ